MELPLSEGEAMSWVIDVTATPVLAHAPRQTFHPPICWICVIVVEFGVGDGVGVGVGVAVGVGVGVGDDEGDGSGVGDGDGDPAGVGVGKLVGGKAALESVPLLHPANKIESSKVILSATAIFGSLS